MRYRDGTLDYDTVAASDEAGVLCLDPSLADQSQRDEVDINTIVRNFKVTGVLPQRDAPQLEMFADVFDYQSAMNAIRQADEAFMSLPAQVRARFENDAGAFVDFCSAPENLDEVRKMGLAPPAPVAPLEAPEEPQALT